MDLSSLKIIHNNKKQRIYIKDWLLLKPYDKQTRTDSFYLDICNKVKNTIYSSNIAFGLLEYIDKEDIVLLSCFLTSYFEDIISETNIWNSFVRIHKRMYKKHLPFYELDDYYEGEINPEDIQFLIWYFINTIQEDSFVIAENDFIRYYGEVIMEVFDEAWDQAPENKILQSYYQIDANEEDFYIARDIIKTVLLDTYLFYPDVQLSTMEKANDIFQNKNNYEDQKLISLLNDNIDNTINGAYTKLLGIQGKEWVAEILGENHPLSKHYLSISPKIQGLFLYKGQDDYNIFIEHIATGKKFDLTKKSYDDWRSLNKVDTIVFLGIVNWKGEWWFSGISFDVAFDAGLVEKERNSADSRMQVAFLDYKEHDLSKMLLTQLRAFKILNQGAQIAFIPTKKIDEFINNYTRVYNESLNLTDRQRRKAEKRAEKKPVSFSKELQQSGFNIESETSLVFFNPKSGVEVASGVNSAFPLTNNPYFNLDSSEDNTMILFMSEEISTELAMYCVDNFKENLPYLKYGMGKVLIKDIDFLLRFWKGKNYHTKPSISFTNGEES